MSIVDLFFAGIIPGIMLAISDAVIIVSVSLFIKLPRGKFDLCEVWRSFKEARTFVHNLNLKSISEWNLYCKNKLKGFKEKPRDIPSHPDTYKDEWKDWYDWLGKKK